MPYEDYNAVESLFNGGIVLVGEEHVDPGRPRSRELVSEVLDVYFPQTVAIEAQRTDAPRDSGMGLARSFAENYNLPLVAIDDGWRDYAPHPLPASASDIIDDANEFTHPVGPDGDVPRRAIDNNRQLFYELYGEEMSQAMHAEREVAMAARLRWLHEEDSFDGPILASMGVFHVPAVARLLRDGFTSREVDGERIDRDPRRGRPRELIEEVR